MLLTRCRSVKTVCDLLRARWLRAARGNVAFWMQQLGKQSHAFRKTRPRPREISVGVHRIYTSGLHCRQIVPTRRLARGLPTLGVARCISSRKTSAQSLPAAIPKSAPTRLETTARLRGRTGRFPRQGAPSPEPNARHNTAGQTIRGKGCAAAWPRRTLRFQSRRHSAPAPKRALALGQHNRPRRRFRERCQPRLSASVRGVKVSTRGVRSLGNRDSALARSFGGLCDGRVSPVTTGLAASKKIFSGGRAKIHFAALDQFAHLTTRLARAAPADRRGDADPVSLVGEKSAGKSHCVRHADDRIARANVG